MFESAQGGLEEMDRRVVDVLAMPVDGIDGRAGLRLQGKKPFMTLCRTGLSGAVPSIVSKGESCPPTPSSQAFGRHAAAWHLSTAVLPLMSHFRLLICAMLTEMQ